MTAPDSARPPRNARRRGGRALVRFLLMVAILGGYLALVVFLLSVLAPEHVPLTLAGLLLAPFAVITFLRSRRSGGWRY